MTHARFDYYPRCPKPDVVVVVVLKPNSNAAVTTVVLIEDTISRLQVQKPNGCAGVWYDVYDVSIVPNTLFNFGDAIEQTTATGSARFIYHTGTQFLASCR